jgi:hypothetical protein
VLIDAADKRRRGGAGWVSEKKTNERLGAFWVIRRVIDDELLVITKNNHLPFVMIVIQYDQIG